MHFLRDTLADLDANPMRFAEAHLSKAHPLMVHKPVPAGYIRGVDFYPPRQLIPTYANGLKAFHKRLGRFPRIDHPASGADHIFASKFFRPFPVNPNPVQKGGATRFISSADLTARLQQPWQRTVETLDELFSQADLPQGRLLLKPTHGNNDFYAVDSANLLAEKAQIVAHFVRTGRERYGVKWGEWLYAHGQQKILIEAFIDDLTGAEFEFFVRGGKVRVWRRYNPVAIEQRFRGGPRLPQMFYDRDSNALPGQLQGGVRAEEIALDRDQIALMIAVAEDIGQHIEAVRVDFFQRRSGVTLAELTCFTSDGNLVASNPTLEAHFIDAFSLLD